ncbi:MAG: type I restriction enzyme S subunit [bacterium]|jgi:type I restriction enzyme S subunit
MKDSWSIISFGEAIKKNSKSKIQVNDAFESEQYPFFTSGVKILCFNDYLVEGKNIFMSTGGNAQVKFYSGKSSYSTDTFSFTCAKDFDVKFIYYLLCLNIDKINFSYFIGSGLKHLQKDLLEKSVFKLPPILQQQKIAKILSTVDNVIEKTKSAIGKYQAIKQGLMHDLFTRGIDVNTGLLRPTAEDAPALYKESALGLIPKEWEVKKLEEFLILKSGDGITSKDIYSFEEYPVYGGNGLRGYTNTYTHEGAYVLIGRQGALCGNITLADSKFYASEHAVVVTIIDESNVKWVEYKLRLMNLNQYSEASAQPGLSVNKINRLFIKVPNGNEQNLIAEKFIGLESKIQTEHQALAKHQQLKAGLLQDLLTGKVEVSVN